VRSGAKAPCLRHNGPGTWFQEGTFMTIRTMEELERIPVGGSIKVENSRLGKQVFERVLEGFKFNDVVVEPKWFAGHIAAEQVVDFMSGDPEVGDYFLSGSNGYLILRVGDDAFDFARFRHRDGQFVDLMHRSITEVRGYNWRRQSEVPVWHSVALAAYSRVLTESQRTEDLLRQVVDANRARDEANRALTEATAMRAAQVQVVVNGVSPLPLEKAAGAVPDGTTVLTVFAQWARQYTVTTAPARGCQCGAVTRASVAEYLGIAEGAEFTFTVDCGRH
jgi:hypothetical protein